MFCISLKKQIRNLFLHNCDQWARVLYLNPKCNLFKETLWLNRNWEESRIFSRRERSTICILCPKLTVGFHTRSCHTKDAPILFLCLSRKSVVTYVLSPEIWSVFFLFQISIAVDHLMINHKVNHRLSKLTELLHFNDFYNFVLFLFGIHETIL